MMKMITPEHKFKISDTLVSIDDTCTNYGTCYIITDITYSIKTDTWFYEYSYYQHSFEHYCKTSIKYTEENFKKVQE